VLSGPIIARSEISLVDNVTVLIHSSLTKKTKVALSHPKRRKRKLQLA
jgi:hypothetical protein